jgi:plasmid stability protein
MPELLIPNVEETILQKLQERAAAHGRTAADEARTILTEALRGASADPWAVVDAFRERLAASGRTFGDSTELIREDRER